MEMLNIVFVSAIQLMVFRAGDCYDIEVTLPTTSEYKPGDSVSIKCQGTSTAEENLEVYFVKVGYHITGYNGQLLASSGEHSDNEAYPMVLATFGQIDSAVQQKVSNRYAVEGSHSDTEFDYTYTINDLTVEDYGNYSCGVKVGEEVTPTAYAQVKVLGPIEKLAILYLPNGQARTTLKNNLERDNPDNKITFETEAAAAPGELACLIEYTTSPPIEWSVSLYDPYTNKTTDVKDLFQDVFPDPHTLSLNGPLVDVGEDLYYLSPAPTSDGERFGDKDSGKTLKLTGKVGGYDEVEFSTVLDIQYPPKDLKCYPGDAQAPVGTKDFTLLCFVRGNPAPSLTWKANGEALRSGISVQKVDKGPYRVSVLTIAEVQESDFTSYSFEAMNYLATENHPASGQAAWEIKKVEAGAEVHQAPSIDAGSHPWNEEEEETNKASAMSTCGTLLVLLVVSLVLY